MALGAAWDFLKEDSWEKPPRQCANCGKMTPSWIRPEGLEGYFCPDCYTAYHRAKRGG